MYLAVAEARLSLSDFGCLSCFRTSCQALACPALARVRCKHVTCCLRALQRGCCIVFLMLTHQILVRLLQNQLPFHMHQQRCLTSLAAGLFGSCCSSTQQGLPFPVSSNSFWTHPACLGISACHAVTGHMAEVHGCEACDVCM